MGTVAATVVLLIAVLGIAGQGVVLAADTYYVAGKDEFSQSTIPERTADATRAVKLNPYDSVYRSGLAGVHLDELNASVRALAKARRTGEDTARYTEKVRESFADAESAFRDAIAFAPADYANYVNLASVYLVAAPELGDELYQRAIDIAKQGLEVMPYGIDIRLRLAEALRNTGRETEATETLAYCVQIDPRAGTAALMLADIYREQGRAAEALALLKSVEALAPGQAGVAAVIRELEAGGAAQ